MQRLLLSLLLCPLTVAAQSTLNDLDGDGCVGATDILVILGQYGECNDTTTAFACGDSVLFDNYWYETVLIGNQCWFAENLRTTVYTNGDSIPAQLTVAEWTSTTTGATAVYGEGNSGCITWSPSIDACDEAQSLGDYGRLYNWYAVDDARGLCPESWAVPSSTDWDTLTTWITNNVYYQAGYTLRSTNGWIWSGSNAVGFNGLPGGMRHDVNGNFYDGGRYALWWTSTSADMNADYRAIAEPLLIGQRPFRFGHSVRCIKYD